MCVCRCGSIRHLGMTGQLYGVGGESEGVRLEEWRDAGEDVVSGEEAKGCLGVQRRRRGPSPPWRNTYYLVPGISVSSAVYFWSLERLWTAGEGYKVSYFGDGRSRWGERGERRGRGGDIWPNLDSDLELSKEGEISPFSHFHELRTRVCRRNAVNVDEVGLVRVKFRLNHVDLTPVTFFTSHTLRLRVEDETGVGYTSVLFQGDLLGTRMHARVCACVCKLVS